MSERRAPFTLQQIGTGTARFPSGVAIPTVTDAAVDPYIKTRIPKETQVECLQFWPQEKGSYPGIVLLHDWWGLNSQIKDLGNRLACEGYGVIIPNLYGRQGGMVTANLEVAQALMGRMNQEAVLQDINSCCEFLNTRDYIKRNIHAVVGYGLGGSLALRFACRRKRLRAAVAFYGKVLETTALKDLYCPVLYHQAGKDEWAQEEDAARLRTAGTEYGKKIRVQVYPDASHAFCDETRRDSYHQRAAAQAWDATADFLRTCFSGA
jgi:carboxymethylenebutenolidase